MDYFGYGLAFTLLLYKILALVHELYFYPLNACFICNVVSIALI